MVPFKVQVHGPTKVMAPLPVPLVMGTLMMVDPWVTPPVLTVPASCNNPVAPPLRVRKQEPGPSVPLSMPAQVLVRFMVTVREPWLPELVGPAEKQAMSAFVKMTRESLCVEVADHSAVVFQMALPPMLVVPVGSQYKIVAADAL